MKKTLLILASAALLLVSCAKEQIDDLQDGEMTNVTFTANLESGVVTKAVADNDGKGVFVNRCIMEIYYGDALYARQISKVTDKQATFNAQVVSNRGYTVAFWADCVDDATSDTGLAADKYYNTASLKEITINGSYVGNDDARDAFFVCEPFTVQQTGGAFSATLKRPFAQMNVITTDWDKVTTVAALIPEKVNVTLKNPMVKFNAVTGEASADANTPSLTYTAAVYTAPAPEEPVSTTVKTLSMDYLFASADKAVIDIDWKALHGTDTDVEHTFAAVPYQRNFRTNIKGALLTTQGQWTVTVEPTWSAPDYTHPVVIATTLEEAQAALGPESASETEAAGIVIVQPEAVTNRDQSHDKDAEYIETKTSGITLPDGAKAIEFVLTQQSQKDVTFELPALPSDNFYWYIRHEEGYPTENLNIKVDSNDATRVIVDAPDDTHVVLNDVVYAHVVAITGENTLVVPQGITVKKLTVKKGGVEIHGTVEELEITGTKEEVFFRSCEGLSADVFAKIYDEDTPTNYIDPWYTYEKVGEVYNIYKLPVVAKIGDIEYKSMSDAIAAAVANDVIDVVAESIEMPKLSKADITVKGNGTTKVTQFGGLSGKNVTLDGFEFTVETNPSGENFVIKNSKFTGTNGLRWAYAYGEVLIENCIFDTKTYGIHFDSNTGGIVTVKNCEITGFNTFNPLLIFDNCKFVDSKIDNKYYVVQSWSDIVIKNCSFSEKWCDAAGAQTIGLTTETGLAEISNCTFATGTVYDACKNSELGVIAIDATGNATDGFTAGTFMAKQASDIKVAPLYAAKAVEGKDNVYTVVADPVAKIGDNIYGTLAAALEAAVNNDVVVLCKDIVKAVAGDNSDRETYSVSDKNITFDLNGHTIKHRYGLNKYGVFEVKNSTLTIDDSSTEKNGKIADTYAQAVLYVENSNINLKNGILAAEYTSTSSTNYRVVKLKNSTFNMDGGSVLAATTGNYNRAFEFVHSTGTNSKVIVNNGVIKTFTSYGVVFYGDSGGYDSENNVVEINGGEISTVGNFGWLGDDVFGEIVMNGGSFTSNWHQVVDSNTKFTHNGGTVNIKTN